MTRFIKLSLAIINTSHISKIINKNDKYLLYFCTSQLDSFFLVGCGGIISDTYKMKICKKENSDDYKIISDWIEKL